MKKNTTGYYVAVPEEKTNDRLIDKSLTKKKNQAEKEFSKSIIKMPEMNGDTQIYLGQAILMLIRMGIDNTFTYSDKNKHFFKVELMSSILEELDITPEEIIEYRETNNEDD